MGAAGEADAGVMAMFPLSAVLFPHAPLSLHVFEPRYRQLTADCLAGSRELGIVLITRGSEVGGNDERSDVGTVAGIEEAVPLPDGRWFLLLSGRRRVAVDEWLPDDPYPRAKVTALPDAASPDAAAEASALRRALSAVRQARGLLSEAGRAPALVLSEADLGEEPGVASWRLCDAAPVGPLDRQRLLECPGVGERLDMLARLSAEVADDVRRMLSGGAS